MNSGRQVAMLIRQLSEVTGRNRAVLVEGSQGGVISGVVHSLRLTLAALVESGSSGPLLERGLRLVAQPRGGVELRQGNLLVPIPGQTFRSLLEVSGLCLVPGQVLLLDPGLARSIVEEALSTVSQEEVEIKGRKIRLLAASIGLEDGEHPDGRPSGRPAPSAA
jgi:hypothetical protein